MAVDLNLNKEELWSKVLKHVELELSAANFKTWFKDTFILNINNNVLELGVPNKIVKDWLSQKYHIFILKILSGQGLNIKNIEYKVHKKMQVAKEEGVGESVNKTLPIKNKMYVNVKDNLNPKYTFESFVVGKFNQLAHAAAEAVIENPGIIYNPLFIYGSTGHGKTHLIQAVGNYLKNRLEDFKVFYVTSEKFTVDYVNAIKSGKANSFKDKYRQYDLLIMDDIQFIANKEQTQEELFHLFNAFHDQNKQIVFSSDKHPNQIPGFAERLKSRFAAGMIAEIPAPDFESRIEILKLKAQKQGVALSQKLAEFVAENLEGNIRELEGILNYIVIQYKINNKEPDFDSVLNTISQIYKPKNNISPQKILEHVTQYYKISKNDIKKKTRKREVVYPRQVLMYILREYYDVSFPSIGDLLGGKDHTTVMHSYEKIKKDLLKDPKLKKEVEEILLILKQNY